MILLMQISINRFFVKILERIVASFVFYSKKVEVQKTLEKLRIRYEDLQVTSGVFQGLRYPGFISFGSALYPKLSGIYESELFPIIEELKTKYDYKIIINIGCAEGYYAVGLAMLFKKSIVFAYDIDKSYNEVINEFAKLNGVENRVKFKIATNNDSAFDNIKNQKSLLFCDCEGCENYLFNEKTRSMLISSDMIIETHDLAEPGVTNNLLGLFKDTHDVRIFYVSSKIEKMEVFKDSFKKFSELEKEICIEEGRSHSKAWLFFKAKEG